MIAKITIRDAFMNDFVFKVRSWYLLTIADTHFNYFIKQQEVACMWVDV